MRRPERFRCCTKCIAHERLSACVSAQPSSPLPSARERATSLADTIPSRARFVGGPREDPFIMPKPCSKEVTSAAADSHCPRSCGSCYVFAAVALVEAAVAITFNTTPIPLSHVRAARHFRTPADEAQTPQHSS